MSHREEGTGHKVLTCVGSRRGEEMKEWGKLISLHGVVIRV